MTTIKTYSEEQILMALTNVSKAVRTKTNDTSLFATLSRGFSPESPLIPLLKESLSATTNPESQQAFDNLYRELSPGDLAVFLQATHQEEFFAIKDLLSGLRVSKYGLTPAYTRAKDLEPSFFFPRLFLVKVKATAPHEPGTPRKYLCDIVDKTGKNSNMPPILCPEENMFVSEDDIETVRNLYTDNVKASTAWLDEMCAVKTEELKSYITRLLSAITEDFDASLEAVESFETAMGA